jgi:hypothetical protein
MQPVVLALPIIVVIPAVMQGPLRRRIQLNRTVIQKEVTLKIRQAHSEQTPLGAGALPKGLDNLASAVLTALKKGTV